jgi:hypothetical protein
MPEGDVEARLILSHDAGAAAATKKAVADALAQQQQLAKSNLLGVEIAQEQAQAEKAAAAAMEKATAAAKAKAAATKTVVDVIKDLDRQKAIDNLAAKYAKLAKNTRDATGAADGLQKELVALNATQSEIGGAAGDFAAQSVPGGGKNRLARIGSELRALPSTQTGLGFGTDAVGNFLRLGGALGGVSEKAAQATVIGTALTPVLGATAAGFAAMAVAAAPFVIAIAAVALAVKGVADEAARQAAIINSTIDAQRATNEKIAGGATTADLQKELDDLKEKRDAEAALLAKLKTNYEENINSQGVLSGVMKVTSGAEEALSSQIGKSTEALTGYDTTLQDLQAAIDSGATAANDAAEAEAKLAEERTKATLDAADTAGKELAAQQKALNATEAQNKARLESIGNERAVIEKQLSVLQGSGDQSEEVQSKIADLNAELQRLGNESSFISDVALNVSRLKDRQKAIEKEIEKNAQDITRKEEEVGRKRHDAAVKYSDALVDIATRAADAAEDAFTKLQDTFSKQQTDFARDIDDLSVKANRSRLEEELKSHEDEARELRDHQHKLEAIRDNAVTEELDQLRKRDFLAAALIREKAVRELEAESKTFTGGQAEQNTAEEEDRARALRELENARNDRLLALQRQNEDARIAYDNDLRNADIAAERAEQQANTNRQRELRAANEVANEVLKIKERQAQLEIELAQSVVDVLMAMQNATQGNAAPQGFGGNASTTNNNQRNTTLNMPIQSMANPNQMRAVTIKTLGELGLVG